MYRALAYFSGLSTLVIPHTLLAHEVYVLDPLTVETMIVRASPNPFAAYAGNEYQFILWGCIAFVVVSTVLAASLFRVFESATYRFFAHLKRFAHPIVRLTAGASLVVYGANGSFYGPELSFAHFGTGAPLIQVAFLVLGACILLGFQTRLAAGYATLLFFSGFVSVGSYMLTYLHQLAAYTFLIILGGGRWSVDHHFFLGLQFRKTLERAAPLAFFILRVGLGASIVWASVYGKFLHSNLALAVVEQYDLTALFPFSPLFIVSGAFIIEFLAGLMLIVGIEIRWTAVFLVFWMTLGHLYMAEPWWVHLPLYGYGLAILCHGYDRYALLGRLFKRDGREPVL